MAWLRLYDELLDDPKVQRLPGDDFKAWVNLLCLARRNDGFLPAEEEIAFALRIDRIACRSLIDRLTIAGLIDTVKGGPNGSRIAPHSWTKRQYKSDTSTERVKRFREHSAAVSETPPDTETESETEKKKEEGGGKPPTSYAFFGQTVRLTPQHLDRWRKTYSAIHDIEAELSTIDAWWQSQEPDERKQWFHRTAGMLNRKHQEMLASKKRDDGYDPDVITV